MEGVKRPRLLGYQLSNETVDTSSSDDDFQHASPTKRHSKVSSPKKTIPLATKKRFNCVKCQYCTNEKQNLVKHLKRHENSSRPAEFTCAKCDYKTDKASNWTRHLTSSKHQSLSGEIASSDFGFKCPELNCSFGGKRMETIYLHLSNPHDKPIEKEELTFETENMFKDWKSNLQADECIKYIKTPTRTKTQIYSCHRSGIFQTKEDRLRELKKIGTVKSGKVCTSRLRVTKEDNQIKVTYWKTHTGHNIEPGKVGITTPQKQLLAASLKEGVPKHRVIQNVQQNPGSNITPISLVTNQDLVNIGKKFRVSKLINLDRNDAKSIHLKYLELKNSGDNSIFMYKPCGELSTEYPSLKENDFVLAYMNNGQEHLLKTAGTRLVCIDSTHGTNSYGFEMTTLITTNDEFEGFPLVFFFHSSKSQETYTEFVQSLCSRTGQIKTTVFMSDDEPAFYNAWKTVMGPAGKKLLCSWHVLHNWSKKLAPLNKDRKSKLFGRLRVVMQELKQDVFEAAFENLLIEIQQDPTLSRFHHYFSSYWQRKDEWAYCYRNHAGINTNMMLEHMHKEIKYKYLKGKKVKRLDEGFNGVLEYLKQRQYDRIISEYRGKVTTKDHALREAHKRMRNASVDLIQMVGESWICTSFSDPLKFYNLVRLKDNCNCCTRCSVCLVCIHIFKCSCPENSIRTNMCKHIHLLCKSMTKDTEIVDSSDDEDLVIDTNTFSEQRQEELQFHLLDLNRKPATTNGRYSCATVKEQLEKALEIASNVDDYAILQTCISEAKEQIQERKSALASFPVMHQYQQPGNTNIEKQLRFVTKKKKQHHVTSQLDRDEIMKELLPVRLFYDQSDSQQSVHTFENNLEVFDSSDIPCSMEMEIA